MFYIYMHTYYYVSYYIRVVYVYVCVYELSLLNYVHKSVHVQNRLK